MNMASQNTVFKTLVGCLAGVTLTACGIIGDRSSEYVAADQGEQIVIPEGLSARQLAALYPIPEIENSRKLPKEFVLPEPPDATAVLDDNPYLIESLNDDVWLKLFTSPGKVWPLLDLFWREYQVGIQSEDISKGQLVTSPISEVSNAELIAGLAKQFDAVELTGLTFQIELRQGVRRNSAELLLKSSVDQTLTSSQLSQLNTAALDLIGTYITSGDIQNRHSLLATDIESDSRIRLLEDENNRSYLELELSYLRAWSEIEKALKSAGVQIGDLNRSEGVFLLHSIETESASSWLNFGSEADENKPFNYEIRLIDEQNGVIKVKVSLLNPELDDASHNELVSLVFEHIS